MKANVAQTTTNMVSVAVITEIATRCMVGVLGEELSSMAGDINLNNNTLPDIIVREVQSQIAEIHGELA